MPESKLWLLNHVGNVFTLSTKQHKFSQLGSSTCSDAVTLKRLSSSSWCAWGLGHDHRVYIYVFPSDVPIRVPDTLYENQRYLPFHGFSQRGLFPMDRYAWSDELGVKDTPKESFRLPSAHWSWEGDWMVDENLRGEVAGVEGWQYAIDFPSSHYTPEKHWKSCVRKRKWIRFRRFTSTGVWVRVSDMEVVENAECFIDVSVGGSYLPSQPPGFLSVWAVTNTGHVYVRTGVCLDQPEGDVWQTVSLGSNRGVVNICVGASNLVWAISWDGQALVRTGINRNRIYGNQWEVVECPDDSIRFMQVAVGKNVVWALSREGKVWFRKGTCGDDIEGNISSLIGSLWVEMVGNMSYLSVSVNDQVFGLDPNDGSVYFRHGITSSNLTGKTWLKVSLHEDVSRFEAAVSQTCTCPLEDSRGASPCCDFHKRRAGSLTASYSSTNTSIETDETLSDVILSPAAIPPSTTESYHKDTTNPSVYTTNPSVYTTNPSVYTTNPSVYTTNPSVYTTNPSVDTTNPSVYTTNPSVYTTNPSVYTTNPSVYTTNPSVYTTNPSVYTTNPSVYTTNPSVYTTNPSVDTTNPSVYTTNPSVYTTNPSVYTTNPSVYTTNPSVYTTNPSVYTTNPSVYTTNPSVYATNPSVYTTNPSVYTTNPSVYTTNPSVYTTNPSVYTSDLVPHQNESVSMETEGGDSPSVDNFNAMKEPIMKPSDLDLVDGPLGNLQEFNVPQDDQMRPSFHHELLPVDGDRSALPDSRIQGGALQTSDGESKVKSFVEELTEVDRFLVEEEILQSTQGGGLSPVVSNSPDVSDVARRQPRHDGRDDTTASGVSHGSRRGLSAVQENSTETKLAQNDGNSTQPNPVMAATVGPPKHSKQKHKPKHSPKPEPSSGGHEPDSIVYKIPKGKKKKKKRECEKEPSGDSHKVSSCVRENHEREMKACVSSKVEMSNPSQFNECSPQRGTENTAQLQQDPVDVCVSVPASEEGKDTSNEKDELDVVIANNEKVNDLKTDDKNVSILELGPEKVCVLKSGQSQSPDCVEDEVFEGDNMILEPNSSTSDSQQGHVDNDPDGRLTDLDPTTHPDSAMAPNQPGDTSPTLTCDERRFSLDSPVSDRIFDFVSFVDDNDDDGDGDKDGVDSSSSNAKDSLPMSPTTSGILDRRINPLQSSSQSTIQTQQSECSQVSGLDVDEGISEWSQEISANPRAQLLLIQPARKVFRYRSTPSPSIPHNIDVLTLDPETLTQTRYAWRSLDVSALHVDDPSTVKWLFKSKDKEEKKNVPKISAALRGEILAKLKARNQREVYQFHNFEQAVKNSTWVKNSKMKLYTRRAGGRWTDCSVEFEYSQSQQDTKCLSVVYYAKKIQKVKQVALKDVSCIKGSSSPDLIRTTIIIHTTTDGHNPLVLQAASESEAMEWMGLLCCACSSQCNLDRPIPAGSVWSCTRSGAILVSPSQPASSTPAHFVWGVHGGHMAVIETGPCGVTWAVGFDRLAYVYNGGYGGAVCMDIPSMSSKLQEMTDFHRVYVYEHQTRYPVVGWCSKGMLGNNFNWTTEAGQSLASQDDVKLPSSKWQWVSSWTVDFNTSGGVNSEGWQFSTLVGDFHRDQHVKDMYRRRRWVRTCRLNTQGPWDSTGSLSLHDVSLQVDPVTAANEAIVVWAVGTNGDVLCRCGVTKDNPSGDNWVHIPTDLDKPFVSISVGGGWRVWGIAGDGSTWYRSGVSQYSPAGNCWLQVVEPPPTNGVLRQVSAGTTAVWAVDTEDNLWRRKNITRTFPEGTDWDLVAARVKRVSVGHKDQVWIVTDSRFANSSEASGSVYRRLAISEDNPRGSKWEKVIGEGWSYVSVRGVAEVNGS